MIREEIWKGDKLNRRLEADVIERFLPSEVEFLKRVGRKESLVLAIDGEYGKGKSWFLDRLAKQLSLSHPVAIIDAWTDDVSDEPLTAFMAAIDHALSPYLSKSKKLSDKLAAAKASAFPVIGKLVSGAAIKAISKVAGDEIDQQLGDVIEKAVRDAKGASPKEEGAAAEALEAAFEKLGSEIDSLVDRRGAALLEAYRQRKTSRHTFRNNMEKLVAEVGATTGSIQPPLIVIIDELDRCRPSYAIKVLEDIKHFFDIPGVVFVIGLHGSQLSKSVKGMYGSEFDSDSYLRRFFTRRYELRGHSIVDLVASLVDEFKIDVKKFAFPKFVVSEGYDINDPKRLGLILTEWNVTPREVLPVLDGLRIFTDGWEHDAPIEPVILLSLLVNVVRGQGLTFQQETQVGQVRLSGISWVTSNGGNPANYTLNEHLKQAIQLAWDPLSSSTRETIYGRNAARNYVLEWLQSELNFRKNDDYFSSNRQSYLADYIPRIAELARFIDRVDD